MRASNTLISRRHPHASPLVGAARGARGAGTQLAVGLVHVFSIDILGTCGEGAAILSAGVLLLEAIELNFILKLGHETHPLGIGRRAGETEGKSFAVCV